MTNVAESLPASILRRKAIVYVRQSTQTQVQTNLESKRRQYDLVEVARAKGFYDVDVIDDDLGRSGSGTVARPGFERLVAALCAGEVGAVLCLDASRLARNGRDWHHLLELCGLVQARVIDMDGIYDPCRPNDRLLLGMKGSISEFELGVLRARMHDAARSMARRGELRISVPIGYNWNREYGLSMDPDRRLQETIRLILSRFAALGSARRTHLSLVADQICFPRPSDGKKLASFEWHPIRYRNVISVLKNPFYAGVYAYGKSEHRTQIVDGRARKTYGHGRARDQWEVMLKDHHEGYIDWEQFERNQRQLAANAYGKAGGPKSGRGGRALLAGLLMCARCGRRLSVAYTGRYPQPVYRCERQNQSLGMRRCMSFSGKRIDAAVTGELLRALEPLSIEAAFKAEQLQMDSRQEQRQIIELDLQKARYEASLAERRYAACDPENRLIIAQLEKSWEASLQRVSALEKRLRAADASATPVVAASELFGLAQDLEAAWNAPLVSTPARQRLMRTLIVDIVADVDEASREIVVTVHWRGGQHSQLRVQKPASGEHGCSTPEQALAVIRSMATRWSDEDIAASLNRMGMRTGQGKTWTAHRVSSLRRVRDIPAYRSATKDGEWLTMSEAASMLRVTNHTIRRLIKDGILAAEQVVAGAPYQIRITDLQSPEVGAAIARKVRPCRGESENQVPMFTSTCEGGAQ
jgi:excisionase family DNA binding protein